MTYKVYISAYLEDTNQILVSFSSDETQREATDYQSLAFDLAAYGDIPIEEIIEKIAVNARTICEDICTQEMYKRDDAKSEATRALVGKTFEFSDVSPVSVSPFREPAIADEAETL